MLSFTKYKEQYSRLESDSATSSLPEDKELSIWPRYWVANRGFNVLEAAWRYVCLLWFVSGAIMMITAGRWVPSEKYCASRLSIWSPLLEVIEYEERDWESSFESKHSGYTGPPTAEMEAKWANIIEVPSVIVPPERVPLLNRSLEQGFLAAPPSSPTSGYVGTIEVFHNLHCLNVLRQYIWRDSYPEGLLPNLFKYNTPEVAKEHVDHCIETLRQTITCSSDVTPYLIYQKKPSGSGKSIEEDFSAFHKCRKFDKLLDWVKENGIIVTMNDVDDT